MSVEIEATDVIKIILQFCKENNLGQSFQTLQRESGVVLNTVENAEEFLNDIREGKWSRILLDTTGMQLPILKTQQLHEQIILELLESREKDAARALLYKSEALGVLQSRDPSKFIELEKLCNRTLLDEKILYKGISKESRRSNLAKTFALEVKSVPASRLLTLLGQAIKWQEQEGLIPQNVKFDIFAGSIPPSKDSEDAFPCKEDAMIKFGAKSYPETALFLQDGNSLITGSTDGFIEIWDVYTSKLRLDLTYQASEKFMMHATSVLALDATKDDDLLASGSQDGQIKVWRISSGHCIRKYDSAHSQGITCLAFSAEKNKLLSSSFDGTMRIHGVKSGKLLKEFRGHESFVNCAEFFSNEETIISGSSDGTVRIWKTSSTECIQILKLPQTSGLDQPVVRASLLPNNCIQICQTNRKATLISLSGDIVKTFQLKEDVPGLLLTCCLSNHGSYLYGLTSEGALVCFDFKSSKMTQIGIAFEKNAIGMALHPHRNLIAAFSRDGMLKLFKPS